jgi:hypothetical protein
VHLWNSSVFFLNVGNKRKGKTVNCTFNLQSSDGKRRNCTCGLTLLDPTYLWCQNKSWLVFVVLSDSLADLQFRTWKGRLLPNGRKTAERDSLSLDFCGYPFNMNRLVFVSFQPSRAPPNNVGLLLLQVRKAFLFVSFKKAFNTFLVGIGDLFVMFGLPNFVHHLSRKKEDQKKVDRGATETS